MKKNNIIYLILVMLTITGCSTKVDSTPIPIDTGIFYNLQTAHDNNWLSKEDLQSISYYYCSEKPHKHFTPISKNPEFLSDGMITQIRQYRWASFSEEDKINKTPEMITIETYNGVYNGLIAVSINDPRYALIQPVYAYYIGGVKFRFWGAPVVELIKLD